MAKSQYDPKYCKEMIAFFDIPLYYEVKETVFMKDGSHKDTIRHVPNALPLIGKFAASIGFTAQALRDWREKHPEFDEAYSISKAHQKSMLINNGLNRLFDSVFSIFAAKNMIGWRDKTEVDLSIKDYADAKYKGLGADELKSKAWEILNGKPRNRIAEIASRN